MAKRAAVKPWASKKPSAKPTSRKPAAKRAPPTPPDTEDDLMSQIGRVLADVNAYMPDRKYNGARFNRYDSEFGPLSKTIENLVERLDKLLSPTGQIAVDLIRTRFGAPPGAVPNWAQPGSFLMWIAYIPCCCIWSGFAEGGSADIVAVDPDEPWFVPSGSISAPVPLYPSYKSPADLFRAYLTDLTIRRELKQPKSRAYNAEPKDLGPAFSLYPLTDSAKEACIATLAAPGNEWIRAGLKRGPVSPIPMPDHLRAVQVALF